MKGEPPPQDRPDKKLPARFFFWCLSCIWCLTLWDRFLARFFDLHSELGVTSSCAYMHTYRGSAVKCVQDVLDTLSLLMAAAKSKFNLQHSIYTTVTVSVDRSRCGVHSILRDSAFGVKRGVLGKALSTKCRCRCHFLNKLGRFNPTVSLTSSHDYI